jgi:hypothetical protein
MQSSYLLTEDNLIGSIASFILQLKRIKDKKETSYDNTFLDKLMDFLGKANEELLYDKYFIISEEVLGLLHQELKEKRISETIDFLELKQNLMEIPEKPDIQNIDKSMVKLKEIAMTLLQLKNQK